MSKYRAIKTEVDGTTFASKKEAKRYQELCLLERAGQIRDLRLQPKFELSVNGEHICDYIGDFNYVENGKVVIEDTKGVRTPVYRLKKKLVHALYKFDILET